jgi:hypothetical protein
MEEHGALTQYSRCRVRMIQGAFRRLASEAYG